MNKKFFTFIQKEKDVGVEHDLRGLRLDEFENRINILVSDLLCKTIPFLIIIHGHGDGILKKWLREFIKKNKALRWEQGQNGNDGETRIYIV